MHLAFLLYELSLASVLTLSGSLWASQAADSFRDAGGKDLVRVICSSITRLFTSLASVSLGYCSRR